MKILHTSDWHIGRFLNGYSLLQDQHYFLNWLLELIREEEVDILIVAGDIYNTASPSAASVEILDEFFSKLILEQKKKAFIVSGNHDSPEKLGFSSKILEKSGFVISTSLNDIKNIKIESDGFSVGFVLLPYFEFMDVKNVFNDDNILNFDMAVEYIYKKNIDKKLTADVNILVAHGLFFDYSKTSLNFCDSETIVGGCESADFSKFCEFSYVALGHLHGPQKAGKNGIYSGSPLKYSVSEAKHKKQLILLDIKTPSDIETKKIYIKPLRDLIIKKGRFKELLNFKTKDFVSIKLTDDSFIIDPYVRLKENIPNLLELEYLNILVNPKRTFKKYIKKDPAELFEEFYEFVVGKKISHKEKEFMTNVFKDIEKEKLLK